MRSSAFLSVLFLALVAGHVFAQAGGEAGDQYFKGYLLKNDAERLEQAGDLATAQQKYQEAEQIIAGVARNYPTWQPEVVSYRLKMIEAALQRLATKGATPMPPALGTLPAAPTYQPAPPAPATGQPLPGTQPLAAPQTPSGAPANPLEAFNLQWQAMQKQNSELRTRVELYERGYNGALAERDGLLKEKDMLAKRAQELMSTIGAMERDSTTANATNLQQIAKLKDELKMVNEMTGSRQKQLDEKDKAIASLEAEKKALIEKQKKTEDELASVKKDNVPKGDFDKLLADNKRLKQELDTAQEQVIALKKSGEKKDTEIASLKTQLGGIQGELAKLRQENNAYQGQVAELTTKLKEMDARLAQSSKKGDKSPASGKLAEENQALRNVILRQLRQQERQRQAKELVIAEMKKMENSSQQLMENLEAMTSAKIVITMDEEKLFSTQELQEIAAATGPRATLIASSNKSHRSEKAEESGSSSQSTTAGVNNEALSQLMEKASRSAAAGDYKAADQSYQDALRADPKNSVALLSLAIIKQIQHQYDDAKVLLQKCLVYDPDNEQAHYRMGVCYFQQSQFPEAMSSFEKSLAQNPSSARSHHYMGIIASRMGNRDRAESEFKQSLAIDPKYGDAHFNLAVLYATSEPPNWNLARQHYQNALDRGIKADPTLEKLLKQSNTPVPTPSTAAAH